MSEKKQMKKAAQNVKRTRATTKKKQQPNKRNNFWNRVWSIICWPFQKIAQCFRRILKWIAGLDVICLINSTLIVAIIVLFTALIVNLYNCRRQHIVVIAESVPVAQNAYTAKPVTTLPLKNSDGRRVVARPTNKSEVAIVKQQTAIQGNKLTGEVIIDSHSAGVILRNKTVVNGNLYLQNMRKFVLPCDVQINGNLFLRDLNMLQFCGDFTVTGNIYVSPRSSFGPIPKTARIGGYVVL